jgi:hypothetical protein
MNPMKPFPVNFLPSGSFVEFSHYEGVARTVGTTDSELINMTLSLSAPERRLIVLKRSQRQVNTRTLREGDEGLSVRMVKRKVSP